MKTILQAQITTFAQCLNNFSIKLKASSRFIFICGAKPNPVNPTARDLVKQYADKYLKSFQFFMAEDFFSFFDNSKRINLLSLEADLCKYSDCTIIILEGASAFAELGAFSLHNDLVQQVLIVNETRYKDKDSFIVRGPIAKVNSESLFTPTIHADFDTILSSVVNIESSLEKIKRFKVEDINLRTLDDLVRCKYKNRLLFIADLISFFGPIREFEILGVLAEIYKPRVVFKDFEVLFGIKLCNLLKREIALLVALKLVKKKGVFYHRVSGDNWLYYKYPGIVPGELRADVIVLFNKRSKMRLDGIVN